MTVLPSMLSVTASRAGTPGLPGFAPLRPETSDGNTGNPANGGSLFSQLMASLEQAAYSADDQGQLSSTISNDPLAALAEAGGSELGELIRKLQQGVGPDEAAQLSAEDILDQLKLLAQAVTTGEIPAAAGSGELQQAWMAFLDGLRAAGLTGGGTSFSVNQGFSGGADHAGKRLPASLQGLTRGEVPREFVTTSPVPTAPRPVAEQAGSMRSSGSIFELLSALVGQQREARDAALRGGVAGGTAELRTEGAGTGVSGAIGTRPVIQEWAPVRVDTRHDQWARDLVSALGDRLNMQVSQQVREATVRLDPPELGKVELIVRMDGDRLNIQLNASSVGVRDMLTQHAERLRMDLLAQNLQTVDVQVGEHGERDQPAGSAIFQTVIADNPELVDEPDDETGADREAHRWLSTSA